MKPIKFKEQTHTYAEDQPEYIPLPVHKDYEGAVTSCWQLTWKERLQVLIYGKVWHTQLTFNQPLQPILKYAKNPFKIYER